LVVGSGGVGFIAVAPYRPASNYTAANNNQVPIFVSAGTYNPGSNIFPVLDTGAAIGVGVTPINWITPYQIGDTSSGDKRFRNTFCGIRISCSGSLLNVSGDYGFYQDPAHLSLSGIVDGAFTMQAGFYTDTISKTEGWSYHVWVPVDEQEYQYTYDFNVTGILPNFIANGNKIAHHIGIMLMGANPGSTFRFEVVAGFEAVGTTVSGKTKSDVDVVGLGDVQSVVNVDTAPVLDKNPSYVDKMVSKVDTTQLMNKLVEIGGNAATAAGMFGLNYLNNAAFGRPYQLVNSGPTVTVQEVEGVRQHTGHTTDDGIRISDLTEEEIREMNEEYAEDTDEGITIHLGDDPKPPLIPPPSQEVYVPPTSQSRNSTGVSTTGHDELKRTALRAPQPVKISGRAVERPVSRTPTI